MILTARAGTSDLGNLTTNVPNGEGAISALRFDRRDAKQNCDLLCSSVNRNLIKYIMWGVLGL